MLLKEDGFIETGSAARPPVLFGGLVALAELLDETSFGARLFGFQPPI